MNIIILLLQSIQVLPSMQGPQYYFECMVPHFIYLFSNKFLRVINFTIFVRQYFAGYIFCNFNTQITQKGHQIFTKSLNFLKFLDKL